MADRDRQIADIILAAIAAGERDAVTAPPPTGGAPSNGDGANDDQIDEARQAVIARCVALKENDLGNGKRMLAHYGDEFLHVSQVGYHIYDGRRWKEDEDGHLIRRKAHQVATFIEKESGSIEPTERQQQLLDAADRAAADLDALPPSPERSETDRETADRLQARIAMGKAVTSGLARRRGARSKFAKSCGNTSRIDNMIKEAAPYRSCAVDQIDADPLALNLKNGTLRFIEHDGEWDCRLDPHDRADNITKLLPTAYDGEADAPVFNRFLEQMVPSTEIRAFLQRYFGYALTAIATEEVFCFFHGDGNNGKSTLVDLICALMADYATTVPFETLAGEDRRKGAEATPDLAKLPGCRLVRSSEPELGVRLKEGMVKQLTSREPIMTRRLHKEFIEVYPTFKLVISGNHKPDIRGTDRGIWRRVLLVPFDVTIPDADVDNRLSEKLTAERQGVLAWLVEGTLWYLNEGLNPPAEILAATADFREESDPLGGYIEACLDLTADMADELTPAALYAEFEKYCERSGMNLWLKTTFTKRFSERAKQIKEMMKHKSQGVRVYKGVRLKPPPAVYGSLNDRL